MMALMSSRELGVVLLFIAKFLIQTSGAVRCQLPFNSDDPLSFTPPDEFYEEGEYPNKVAVGTAGRLMSTSCCATGFSTIEWFINGTKVSSSDRSIQLSENDQGFDWLDTVPGSTNLTCVVHGFNNDTISNTITLRLSEGCRFGVPWFVQSIEEQCVDQHEITFICEVTFDDPNDCIHPFFRQAYVGAITPDGADTAVIFLIDPQQYEIDSSLSADETTTLFVMDIKNVTEDMYDMQFYCGVTGMAAIKSKPARLTRGPCETKPVIKEYRTFDASIALKIAVPVICLTALLVMVAAIVFIKRDELIIRYYTIFSISKYAIEDCKYDGYLLYSDDADDELFATSELLIELEKRYNICVPERDFNLGTILPEATAQHLLCSKRLIVVLSDSLVQHDWVSLHIHFAIQNRIQLVFIKYHLTSKQKLKQVRRLPAAVKASKVLEYPNWSEDPEKIDNGDSSSNSVADFYDSLYKAMPLIKKTEQRESSSQ